MGNRAEGLMGKRRALEKSLAGEVSGSVHAAAIDKFKPKREEKEKKLLAMFDEWVKKFNKKYSTEEERQKRFLNFRSSKERLDELNSCPSTLESFNGLADLSNSEFITGSPACFPPIDYADELMEQYILQIKADDEELKEAKLEFNKWVKQFGKTYDTVEEEHKRFLIFLVSKRTVDACKDPLGYNVANMDKTWWEQAEEAGLIGG